MYNERDDCGPDVIDPEGDQMQEPQKRVRPEAKAVDEEFVEFVRTGDRAAGSFACTACGYGVVVRGELPPCPMCRTTLWERSEWSLFSNALSSLARIRGGG